MRKLIVTFMSLGLLAGLLPQAFAAKTAAPVWEDVAGDADGAQGTGQSIPAGFDLVSGTIVKNGTNLEFTVTHADMPPAGSLPEGARFLWAFSVGANSYRITAKSADIGKPDLLAGQTTDRVGQVDPTGHFRLEGDCKTGEPIGVLTPTNCAPLAYVEGAFDPATKSFTVMIPMKDVKAKKGSVIAAGSGESVAICALCWVSHIAERSLNTVIIDSAAMTGTYKVR